MHGVPHSHTVRFSSVCSVGLCRRRACSMALEASCFIKHVIKNYLKKNRPSSWHRLPRPQFERAATKARRTSLRTFLCFATGSSCEIGLPVRLLPTAHNLQEPVVTAALSTVMSVFAQKRLRFPHMHIRSCC